MRSERATLTRVAMRVWLAVLCAAGLAMMATQASAQANAPSGPSPGPQPNAPTNTQTNAQTAEPGTHIRELIPKAAMVGRGRFTWFGFHVYDGALFAPERKFDANQPHALELTYARELKGVKIAERSIDEIAALGIGTESERAAWLPLLTRIFPDVRQGDRLAGVSSGDKALFFFNGKAAGEITDAKLARAFFAIWLDARTSAPTFRARLLGLDK